MISRLLSLKWCNVFSGSFSLFRRFSSSFSSSFTFLFIYFFSRINLGSSFRVFPSTSVHSIASLSLESRQGRALTASPISRARTSRFIGFQGAEQNLYLSAKLLRSRNRNCANPLNEPSGVFFPLPV